MPEANKRGKVAEIPVPDFALLNPGYEQLPDSWKVK